MLIFIHGLESSGKGFKGRFFKSIFPEILTPDFTGDFAERMKKLETILKNKENLILIGSSFGGLMATKFTCENEKRVKKLILLAPALNYKKILNNCKINIPVFIFHGKNDEVIDIITIKNIAKNIFNNLHFYEVDDNHLLHETIKKIDWKKLIYN